MALEGSGSAGKHGDSQVSAASHSTQPPVHRGGRGGKEEGGGERERLDSYFISPRGFNHFVGAVKAGRIVSCFKDDNLKEA